MQHQLTNTAIVFMQQNYDQHLSGNRHQLVSRCVARLQEVWDISTSLAERISAAALAEIESGGIACIDQTESTGSAVVLRMKNGDVFSISAAAIAHAAAHYAVPISKH